MYVTGRQGLSSRKQSILCLVRITFRLIVEDSSVSCHKRDARKLLSSYFFHSNLTLRVGFSVVLSGMSTILRIQTAIGLGMYSNCYCRVYGRTVDNRVT